MEQIRRLAFSRLSPPVIPHCRHGASDLQSVFLTILILIFPDRLQIRLSRRLLQCPLSVAAVDLIAFDTHQFLAIQGIYTFARNICAKVMPETVRSDVIDRSDRLQNSTWVNG